MEEVNELYDLLWEIKKAAEKNDLAEAKKINEKFSEKYQRTFRGTILEEESIGMLYNRARNNFLCSMGDYGEEIKKRFLKDANDYLSKISVQDSCKPCRNSD